MVKEVSSIPRSSSQGYCRNCLLIFRNWLSASSALTTIQLLEEFERLDEAAGEAKRQHSEEKPLSSQGVAVLKRRRER